jgi:hypothetical protein
VVEENRILEIGPYTGGYVREDELTYPVDCSRVTVSSGGQKFQVHHLQHSDVHVVGEPFWHPDKRVDIAILRFSGIDGNTPTIPLPLFLDEAPSPY